MQFKKDDLSGTYTWAKESGSAIFNGQPTRRKFDRFNGDQILFLINLYASTAEHFSLQKGRMIEDLLANKLPLDASSEISVFNWLGSALIEIL